jgi:integrase
MALEAVATPVESADATAAALCEAFLAWSHRENSPATYGFYRPFLQSFVDLHGAVRVRDLKPYHVTRWFEAHAGWNQSTRRCALTTVKRALNWAVKEGYLDPSPPKAVEKPAVLHRERVVSAREHEAITAAVRDEAFRDFLLAMRGTGCRPGEVSAVTAEHFSAEAGTWTFLRHKTVKKTRKPRVVFLPPPVVELCRRLVAMYPEGPLFRNSRGEPWNRNAIRCRFRRLRKKLKLGPGVVAYCLRWPRPRAAGGGGDGSTRGRPRSLRRRTTLPVPGAGQTPQRSRAILRRPAWSARPAPRGRTGRGVGATAPRRATRTAPSPASARPPG